MRPNANFVRYTMNEDIKEPGSIQFKHVIEIGLTREGESLASGATSSERPKCIVTGGAASMTLVHGGKSYPICCTGCREEFNENPEKYIKKAALLNSSQSGKSKAGQPAVSRVSRFEDAFAGDVADSPEAPSAKAKGAKESAPKAKKTDKAKTVEETKTDDETASADEKPAAKPSSKEKGKSAPAAKAAARAATLLRLGRSSEKNGNPTAALSYYRQIVKDFAKTLSAKAAAERIKAIEKD